MNDAECQRHNIQWSSTEIGTECPACKLENILSKIVRLLRGCASYVPELLKEKIADMLREIKTL